MTFMITAYGHLEAYRRLRGSAHDQTRLGQRSTIDTSFTAKSLILTSLGGKKLYLLE